MNQLDALALLIVMAILLVAAGMLPIRAHVAKLREEEDARKRNMAHPWKF